MKIAVSLVQVLNNPTKLDKLKTPECTEEASN